VFFFCIILPHGHLPAPPLPTFFPKYSATIVFISINGGGMGGVNREGMATIIRREQSMVLLDDDLL